MQLIIDYWYFGTTIVVPVVYFLWSALQSDKKVVAENAKAEGFQVSLDGFDLPSVHVRDQQNVSRLSVIALASYQSEKQLRSKITEAVPECELIEWSEQNGSGGAEGLIAIDMESRTMVIGIAGTDDKQDFIHDALIFSQSMSDWSMANGPPIAIDTHELGVRSTAGFLAALHMSYKGIMRELHAREINPRDYMVYVTGHSLGGAEAELLPLLEEFSGARAYSFGAPKAFRYFSRIPERIGWRVCSVLDAIPHLPPVCRHPRLQTLYLMTPTLRRSKIPLRYLPLFGAYAGLSMLGRWIRRKSGHSMRVYVKWLNGLGY